MYYIGIDTSCYTTSLAVIDSSENLIYDGRILLKVSQGDRGLRQSEAVFQHVRNLSTLAAEAMSKLGNQKPACISVSTSPRDVEGSYMPVFTAGHNIAKVMSSCLDTKLIECSHQQGHILAGSWSIDMALADSYLVYHISGGTTELLAVNEKKSAVIVGGTNDLNAGQFVDRVGVAMGLKFPCGKEMDKLSRAIQEVPLELPISVKGSYLSFSGPESHVQRIIAKEESINEEFKAIISKSVFYNIGHTLERTIAAACKAYGIRNVLVVGGVASNSTISQILQSSRKLQALNINLGISDVNYSSDNAVGAALYGKRTCENFGGFNEQ